MLGAGQAINATRDDGVSSDGDVRRIEVAPNIGEVDRTVVSTRNGPSDHLAELLVFRTALNATHTRTPRFHDA
jgi:hypothetical protein